ncbi:MAG: DUF2332 domain-containing protein [Acidimicrobiales bacterium]
MTDRAASNTSRHEAIRDWYRGFAAEQAKGSSPIYERLSLAVADSPPVIELLTQLRHPKRQPNLLLAAVRFLDGPLEVDDFLTFVVDRGDDVLDVMRARSTQTNEAARTGAFVPALAELPGPLALLEVGASAGLCLQPDRYRYCYHGAARPVAEVGVGELTIDVEARGPVPVAERFPPVVWRAGLDLAPLDVTDPGDVAWLQACVWPEHVERRRRLDAALAIAAADPPAIRRGDLLVDTEALLAEAPAGATKVVYHSAVLVYLDEAGRRAFADTMTRLVDERDDVVWLANEAPGVVPDLAPPPGADARPLRFVVTRNGRDTLALADHHGAWVDWLADS